MAAKKYIELLNGKLTQKQATVTSSGAANDGDLVALDSTGKISETVLPLGVGPDLASAVASEDLAAGDYVNFWDDAGTVKVRLADNSNARDAHGFVKAAYTNGQTAVVYFEGPNEDLAGLTPGARYYLGTAGGVTSTPPSAPAAQILQLLGVAVSTTAINTDVNDCIGLV